jgi:hypothetical protein
MAAASRKDNIGFPVEAMEELFDTCTWAAPGDSLYGDPGHILVQEAILALPPELAPRNEAYTAHFLQLLFLERLAALQAAFTEAKDAASTSYSLWRGSWSKVSLHRPDLDLSLLPGSPPVKASGSSRKGDLVMVFPLREEDCFQSPVLDEGFVAELRSDFAAKDSDGIALPTVLKLKLWAVTPPEACILQAFMDKAFAVHFMASTSKVPHSRQVDAVKNIIKDDGTFDQAVRSLITISWDVQSDIARAIDFLPGNDAADALPGLRALAGGAPKDLKMCGEGRADVPLTSAQQVAVTYAASRVCTLIRGPPGTGKTHTACAIVDRWLSAEKCRVLVVTQSNVAALNIHERLQEFGIDAVRVGFGMVAEELVSQEHFVSLFTPDELKPLYEMILDSPTRSSSRRARVNSGEEPALYTQSLLLQKAVKRATVVVMTCISSGNATLLSGSTFHRVLLDEAAQAPEPTALVPLATGAAAFACVGDDKQLPATVLSWEAKKKGFDESLFTRLLSAGVVVEDDGFVQLDVQRRMHSSILKFPSDKFYDGSIQNGCDDMDRPAPPGMRWPQNDSIRVVFVDCNGREETVGTSTRNLDEADLIATAVEHFVSVSSRTRSSDRISAKDIAVITGYSAQKELLKRCLQTKLGHETARKVRVDTVDGFQGMERELILVSATRSNRQGEVGFLRDARRANVLLTRARRGLIVFGDYKTLNQDKQIWRPWLQWVYENYACYCGAEKFLEALGCSASSGEAFW